MPETFDYGLRQQEFESMLMRLYLSGKYNLFNFDDRWKTNISQSWQSTVYQGQDIQRITPKLSLSLLSSNNFSYSFDENESVQFYSPNLVDIQTYSNYVKYEYINITQPTEVIDKDVDTLLGPGETLTLFWKTTETSNYQYYKYHEGDIIKSTFVIYPSHTSVSSDLANGAGVVLDPTKNAAIEEFNTALSSNRQIMNRKLNVVSLNNAFNYVYWIRNYTALDNAGNKVYELFEEYSDVDLSSLTGPLTYILHSGEYLIYTNESFTSLNIVGAGTEIQLTPTSSFTGTFPLTVPVIDYSDIISDGISAIAEDNWYVFKNVDALMSFTEMQFVTLSKGCTVRFTYTGAGSAPAQLVLTNDVITLTDWTVSYQIEGDTTTYTLPNIDDPSIHWLCRTSLDVNLTMDTAQVLSSVSNAQYSKVTSLDIQFMDQGTLHTDTLVSCSVLSDRDLFIGGSSTVSTEFLDEQSNITYLHLYPYAPSTASPEFEFLSDQTVRLKLEPDTYNNNEFAVDYVLPTRLVKSELMHDVSMTLSSYILKIIQPSSELTQLIIYMPDESDPSDTSPAGTMWGTYAFNSPGVYFLVVPCSGTLTFTVSGTVTKPTYITIDKCVYSSIKYLGSGAEGAEQVISEDGSSDVDKLVTHKEAYYATYETIRNLSQNIDGKFNFMFAENSSESFNPYDPLDYFNPNNPFSSRTLAKLNNVDIKVINRG